MSLSSARLVITVTSLAVLALFIHTCSFLTTAVTPPRAVLADIEPGQSAWEISRELQEGGVIADAHTFMVIATLTGKARRLQAGSYVFEGNHYPLDIMNILFRGMTQRYRITVPEGYTLFQIGTLVEKTGLLSRQSFIRSAMDPASTTFFKIEAPSMEGFLYPDTYFLVPHITPLEIIAKMIDRFNKIYTPEMEQRAKELGLSMTEVITLASMIEKEAVVQTEKPVISSVFHNRLKRNMRLQSDPTAIYGIEGFSRKISPKDLLRESPYNTYRHHGLPPGPICSPGIESIRAALWPARTDYLYFVARGNGTHAFSRSLQEHNQSISGHIQ
ncbi:MAG TPA: endolytic transglycosylase MltG [Desulfomonilia bacterium]|nr:endolytic transglycosylase MltG [Desulfomonilia bacterium]